jgi:hypothetical protein
MKAILLATILFITGCNMVEPHGCSIGYKVGPEDGCVKETEPAGK